SRVVAVLRGSGALHPPLRPPPDRAVTESDQGGVLPEADAAPPARHPDDARRSPCADGVEAPKRRLAVGGLHDGPREDDRLLDRHARALTEVGCRRMRRIAEKDGSAAMPPSAWRPVQDVVLQD